jgi:hypothetical protein
MSQSLGYKRPGVECENCHEPFALFSATVHDFQTVRALPDPFWAKCAYCDHEATYPKSSIYTLVVVADR